MEITADKLLSQPLLTFALLINKKLIMNTTTEVISPENLLKHWQGHRKLTRRVIEAFLFHRQ